MTSLRSKIETKFNIVREINAENSTVLAEINKLYHTYLMRVTPILIDYDERKFCYAVTQIDVIAKLNKFIPHKEDMLTDITSKFTIDCMKCGICGSSFVVSMTLSELHCHECGNIVNITGVVFDDMQFYNQEGQKAKSGKFSPNRHFNQWKIHVLALESDEELGNKHDKANLYGEKVIAQLRDIIRRDNMIVQLLSVSDVRTMLKEINRTDLNKNVPLILKKLTGIGPPQPPEALIMRIEVLFARAIDIGEQFRHKFKKGIQINRNFYPYYLYKILDVILPKDSCYQKIMYY